jgi:hypothetical protein
MAMSAYLGTRPYDWIKRISKDRKPTDFLYSSMYQTAEWNPFTGTTHLFEKTYVTRPNDPGLWTEFTADPCLGAPCNQPRQTIGHGVDQLSFGRYKRDYQSQVFCLDQINTIEEAPAKLGQIVDGYKDIPDDIVSTFLRALALQKAGSVAQGGGLWLNGVLDSTNGPAAIDITSNMFAVSMGQSVVGSQNTLLINLNANGDLTALGITSTALLQAAMGQLTMENLNQHQEPLAANGYHNKDWLIDGKFSITADGTTARNLLNANPALTGLYKSSDFAKNGAFYSYGMAAGCGDWLFKRDNMQMRFQFRPDLDGKNFAGGSVAGAIWVEEVKPYNNVAATYGKKPVLNTLWINAPIKMYHVFNREARTVYVGDVVSVNPDMKFGLARSFMGKWTWHSPDVILYTDPNTGTQCTLDNVKKNMGFFLGEFDLTIQTVYPEIERVIFALGEPQRAALTPLTIAPSATSGPVAYNQGTPYNANCATIPGGFAVPTED